LKKPLNYLPNLQKSQLIIKSKFRDSWLHCFIKLTAVTRITFPPWTHWLLRTAQVLFNISARN
jgi:hypothetical protein